MGFSNIKNQFLYVWVIGIFPMFTSRHSFSNDLKFVCVFCKLGVQKRRRPFIASNLKSFDYDFKIIKNVCITCHVIGPYRNSLKYQTFLYICYLASCIGELQNNHYRCTCSADRLSVNSTVKRTFISLIFIIFTLATSSNS